MNHLCIAVVASVVGAMSASAAVHGRISLRTAIHNFVAHYRTERHHQSLANRLISPEPGHPGKAGVVERRRAPGRLSELLVPRRRLSV
jgi:hypothetical protein